MSLRFSIVTPTLNQAPFIEECINSVLKQDHPCIEYIIIDGGSTDGTLEIVQKFESQLSFFETGKDSGQSNAIARGFSRASGDILAWLNSDDLYLEGALSTVATVFEQNPDAVLVYGDYLVEQSNGKRLYKHKVSWNHTVAVHAYLMIPQPSAFWRRSAFEAVGGLDEHLHYCMDYDLFLRMSCAFPGRFVHVKQPFSVFRLHSDSKTVRNDGVFRTENKLVRSKFTSTGKITHKVLKYFCYIWLQWKCLTERGRLYWRKQVYS
jgi:glycosyltransferase involved in cell wall biosynthesis